MSSHIPSRLTEAQFRRFEPVIKQAIEKFPEPIAVTVPNLAFSTTIARCRDALQSIQTFKWPTDWVIDLDTLKKLKVFQKDDNIFLGGSLPKVALTTATPTTVRPPEGVLTLTYSTLHALATLVHASTWPGVSFTFRWTDSENEFNPAKQKVLEKFDIAIIPHPDFENTHVLL